MASKKDNASKEQFQATLQAVAENLQKKKGGRKNPNRVHARRRLSHMVRALSTGNPETIARVKAWHGEEIYEQARQIWATIDTRQIELRAYAEAVLVEISEQSTQEHVRAKVANDLLQAIDRANTLRSRFDDLKDPDTRAAAVGELRQPTPAALEVFRAAWGDNPPESVVALLESMGFQRKDS